MHINRSYPNDSPSVEIELLASKPEEEAIRVLRLDWMPVYAIRGTNLAVYAQQLLVTGGFRFEAESEAGILEIEQFVQQKCLEIADEVFRYFKYSAELEGGQRDGPRPYLPKGNRDSLKSGPKLSPMIRNSMGKLMKG